MNRELAFLDSLQGRGIHPGKVRMRLLLRAAGNPERSYPSVLVAGTNGKGSTAATLASILTRSGYRTALYTSPHLLALNERWRLDGEDIAEEELLRTVSVLRKLVKSTAVTPTYFEALTMVGFLYFRERGCDVCVLEVGMGGRLDATNVVRPLASLITPVGIDHTDYLGKTIRSIAREKAGIIHRHSLALTSSRDSGVLQVLRRRAKSLEVNLREVPEETQVSVVRSSDHELRFSLQTPLESYRLQSPLLGNHQIDNISLAVRSAELLSTSLPRLNKKGILGGVAETAWRGRLERFGVRDKVVWVDGAHNAHGAARLAEFVRELPRPRSLVFGIMADKDWQTVTKLLFPLFDEVVLTEPKDPRALPVETLARHADSALRAPRARRSAEAALTLALSLEPSVVVVCGSLYVAGSAIEFLDRK